MVVVNKEIFTDYKEIYEKTIKLISEDRKNDPATEPFRSYYVARIALIQMEDTLMNSLMSLLPEKRSDDITTYKVILAFVYRDLGRIYNLVGDPWNAERTLLACIKMMEEHRMLPEAILPYVSALYEMGIIYVNRDNHHKAHETLVRVEHAYQEFKQAATGDAMVIMEIFGSADEVEQGKGAAELESLYTQCAFYLMQVLGHLGQLEKSVEYLHLTLRRQLPLNIINPIELALGTAALSRHFIARNMFKEARHHLAIAQHIMTQYEAKMLTTEMSEQQRADIKETYKHRYADMARYWAKYGLMLLKTSRNRLYNNDDEKLAADAEIMCLDPLVYRFPDMDVSSIEKRVSGNYCLTFNDAKRVYHFVTNWLDRAKEYYTPEMEVVTEYAKIIKDFAELYENVAFFEKDPVSKAKMHKRRAKYYEDLLKLLNPVIHMAICRECWWGCGMAHLSILRLTLEALEATCSPTVQKVQNINQESQKVINNLLKFVKSCMDKDGLRLKSDLSVGEQCNVLCAYFHLGQLHYQMISVDHSVHLENMKTSLKYYKLFTQECADRKEAVALMQAVYGEFHGIMNLTSFEDNTVNEATMRKSRAKYYEDVLELFNPVFNMAICRECWLSCGLEYCAIWKKKYNDALKAYRSSTVQEVQNMNQECQKAIKNFLEFVKSCMDKDGLRLKSDLSVGEQYNVLKVLFGLGDLYYELLTKDLSAKLENLKNSLKYYKLFTNRFVELKEATASLQERFVISREKLNLLPLEIANLQMRLGT